ncbi:TPA: winged helix-turn-helix transcriptional regulator [Klebsiella quasipneumoniae subsp. quasipneumoniae]|nr:winged helix-turn-helix transcriptional regulator [Klebsiella quasipneumoniae subsp. quasipneumoniae]
MVEYEPGHYVPAHAGNFGGSGVEPPLDGRCNATALRRASRYVTAIYDQALIPSGIRVSQFAILYQLFRHGAQPVGQLADIMAMDRSTLSTNLRLLERDGLVKKAEVKDRRQRASQITNEGIKRFEVALPLWERIQADFEGRFGQERSGTLRHELKEVLNTGFLPWAENIQTCQSHQ